MKTYSDYMHDKSSFYKKREMKILLINPPHLSIGSRMPKEHLPPLGLLSIGGPLIDSGYEVKLLDADFGALKYHEIVEETIKCSPDIVMLGHSGSTSAQPIISEITKLIKEVKIDIKIIIGGVFPTYHWEEILEENRQIDFIVLGEGEDTIQKLVKSIEEGTPVDDVKGIAYRNNELIVKNLPSEIIELDNYRIGWELMQGYNYTYWGNKKAVVIQFSRGCSCSCVYCGQSVFWKKWRHRNPQLLADEIEMLHKKYQIEVINFADEHPSINKNAWKEFLEALIKKNLPLILVGSIRADSIVRDADILHLYKKAGFDRFLLGIENYDEDILKDIKKGSSVSTDKEAIRLLRKHDILSMATYVVGFGEETMRDFYTSLKQLLYYDPDQIQLLYVTPHRWTQYFEQVKEKQLVQLDQKKWDYKHQVLEINKLNPLIVIILVKLIEICMQARPKSLIRLFFHKDKRLKKAMKWYYRIGRKVWFYELFSFLFSDKPANKGVLLKDFWGNQIK